MTRDPRGAHAPETSKPSVLHRGLVKAFVVSPDLTRLRLTRTAFLTLFPLVPSQPWEHAMPSKRATRLCACGCGRQPVAGVWVPGHDQKLRAALERALEEAGEPNGLLALRKMVEARLGREIKP